MSQDSYRFLSHFRAAYGRDETAQRASAQSLAESPGRSAGRQAAWAFGRAAGLLAMQQRRSLVIGDGLSPSADERRLLLVAEAVAGGDLAAAREASLWLIRRPAVDRFLEAISLAVAGTLGKARTRRAA